MRSLAVAMCALSFVMSGCDELTCGPPEEAEFTCEPVAAGTANTCGAIRFKGTTYGEGNAFPLGCRVRLPECVDAYPDNVQTCDCIMLGDAPQWACPI
jgi:hypothetical protein